MKKIVLIASMGLLLMVLGIWGAIAQEASKAPQTPVKTTPAAAPAVTPTSTPTQAPAPETKMAYGEVLTLDATNRVVTIKEYDYEQDKYTDSTYSISRDVKLEGDVISVNEIKTGDFLDIEYKTEADKKTAIYIYIERPQMQVPSGENTETPAVAVPETEETE